MHRVAVDRDQEVHRDRRHLELAQRERDLDHVGAALAHAEDEPAARLDAVLLRREQRAHAVRVACASSRSRRSGARSCSGCGSGDRGRRRPGCARAPRRAGRPRGRPRSGSAALISRIRSASSRVRCERRAAAREHHAVARRAGARGALGLGEDLLVALHRVLADRRASSPSTASSSRSPRGRARSARCSARAPCTLRPKWRSRGTNAACSSGSSATSRRVEDPERLVARSAARRAARARRGGRSGRTRGSSGDRRSVRSRGRRAADAAAVNRAADAQRSTASGSSSGAATTARRGAARASVYRLHRVRRAAAALARPLPDLRRLVDAGRGARRRRAPRGAAVRSRRRRDPAAPRKPMRARATSTARRRPAHRDRHRRARPRARRRTRAGLRRAARRRARHRQVDARAPARGEPRGARRVRALRDRRGEPRADPAARRAPAASSRASSLVLAETRVEALAEPWRATRAARSCSSTRSRRCATERVESAPGSVGAGARVRGAARGDGEGRRRRARARRPRHEGGRARRPARARASRRRGARSSRAIAATRSALLRASKNRFGSTHEVGVFTMGEAGLEAVDEPERAVPRRAPRRRAGLVRRAAARGHAADAGRGPGAGRARGLRHRAPHRDRLRRRPRRAAARGARSPRRRRPASRATST